MSPTKALEQNGWEEEDMDHFQKVPSFLGSSSVVTENSPFKYMSFEKENAPERTPLSDFYASPSKYPVNRRDADSNSPPSSPYKVDFISLLPEIT